MIKKISALLFSVVVFLLAGEVFTRILQEMHVIYDFSSGDHVKEKKKFSKFSPGFIKSENPVLYVENDPADPRVNALGMRGRLAENKKPENTYRIAVIGDSISYGFGVPLESSYPYILEKDLTDMRAFQGKNIEVLNFSVSGYGLEAYREVLLHKALKFEPDLVIIGYCLNDISSANGAFVSVSAMKKSSSSYIELSRYSHFIATIKFYAGKIIERKMFELNFREQYENKDVIDRLQGYFTDIKNSGDEHGFRVLVVVFPFFTEFDHYNLIGIHQVLGRILDGSGLWHRDLFADFSKQSAATWRESDDDVTHPNAAGHWLIAHSIEQELLDSASPVESANPGSR